MVNAHPQQRHALPACESHTVGFCAVCWWVHDAFVSTMRSIITVPSLPHKPYHMMSSEPTCDTIPAFFTMPSNARGCTRLSAWPALKVNIQDAGP